jgi:hypothetical protein
VIGAAFETLVRRAAYGGRKGRRAERRIAEAMRTAYRGTWSTDPSPSWATAKPGNLLEDLKFGLALLDRPQVVRIEVGTFAFERMAEIPRAQAKSAGFPGPELAFGHPLMGWPVVLVRAYAPEAVVLVYSDGSREMLS